LSLLPLFGDSSPFNPISLDFFAGLTSAVASPCASGAAGVVSAPCLARRRGMVSPETVLIPYGMLLLLGVFKVVLGTLDTAD
jgi:hypothetical protein